MTNHAGSLRSSSAISRSATPDRTRNRGVSGALCLHGGQVAAGPNGTIRADINIANGWIRRESRANAAIIDLNDYLILPGLINAHDHLEFSLFPRLGNGPYPNCLEWAGDIYRPDRSPVRDHLSIAKPVRLWWGGIKNLLSGVTTVSHHNPYEEDVFRQDFPVHVVRRHGWAHSLAFDTNVGERFLASGANVPFIIHLGEGTDERSGLEIFELDRLNALDRRTVLVHGVGLTADGHELRRRRGASLVWCPTSNRFTLGKTLDAKKFKDEAIALGSDSALTGQGDLLDEIRSAYLEEGVDADAIYSMVTTSAAGILRLLNGEGKLEHGSVADLIAIRTAGAGPADTLVRSDWRDIELVIVAGRPKLVSLEMARRWPSEWLRDFECIRVGGTSRLIHAPVRQLVEQARGSISNVLSLGGKEIVNEH